MKKSIYGIPVTENFPSAIRIEKNKKETVNTLLLDIFINISAEKKM